MHLERSYRYELTVKKVVRQLSTIIEYRQARYGRVPEA